MYGYEEAWIMTAQLNEKKDGCELCMLPLVLCKDCKHRAENHRCYADNPMRGSYVGSNWFCADGERKEGQ